MAIVLWPLRTGLETEISKNLTTFPVPMFSPRTTPEDLAPCDSDPGFQEDNYYVC